MIGQVVLSTYTDPAEVRCHTYTIGPPIGSVEFDGVRVQSQDPALLDALGAAFILAATQLADAIRKVKA